MLCVTCYEVFVMVFNEAIYSINSYTLAGLNLKATGGKILSAQDNISHHIGESNLKFG